MIEQNHLSQMEEDVKKIINRRKKGALSGMLIVAAVVIGMGIIERKINIAFTLFFLLAFISVMFPVYMINKLNYPNPKPGYRFWNKLIYIYLGKVFIVFGILSAISSLRDALNPMSSFKNPDALARPIALADAATSAYVAHSWYKELKPAALVEEYYRLQEQNNEMSTNVS